MPTRRTSAASPTICRDTTLQSLERRVLLSSTIIAVTTTSDDGGGSLRDAITQANNLSTPDATIVFDIPGTGESEQRIELLA